MNFQIWRSKEDRWCLLGCSLFDGGFISISGIWGASQKDRSLQVNPVFEDESSGTVFYMQDKGKNWKLFKALCPELSPFEFWDENRCRLGTLEQEWFLFEQGLLNAPYTEKIAALEKAGMKEVEVAKSESTIFPPSYMGSSYLYGSLQLGFPLPIHLQIELKQIAKKEGA